MKIEIIDRNAAFVEAAKAVFAGTDVSVTCGSIVEGKREAVVSPANSFGFMDGGVDMAYSQRFGWGVQQELQEYIRSLPHGELLVGDAVLIDTHDPDIPCLIAAPTMRVPRIILDPADVLLAARAAIHRAKLCMVEHVAFPGMGTGCGCLNPHTAAQAMRAGIETGLMRRPPFPSSWSTAQARHVGLLG